MAGSGAGWLYLDASWETLLEMASCIGADADADADDFDDYDANVDARSK